MNFLRVMDLKERITLAVAVVGATTAGILHFTHATPLIVFFVAAIALAALASIVGDATDQLGQRLSPGATGVLQSALGNLPELFICIFALRAGLVTVVQTALVGSILGNSLLVLGLAFFVGGLKNGIQNFAIQPARTISTLTLLAVSALILPTLTYALHTPAAGHEDQFSIGVAVILLVIFAASIPMSIARQEKGGARPQGSLAYHLAHSALPASPVAAKEQEEETCWPFALSVILLAFAGVGAAFVSDWFVEALQPAIKALHMSEAFAGLVVVAIAGNAVENVVGIQLAYANKADLALSVILNSSLQVALALTPVLVLLSFVISPHHMTLALSPLLVAVLFLTAFLTAFIVSDGESNWLEGLVLIGLYGIIASAFWWG